MRSCVKWEYPLRSKSVPFDTARKGCKMKIFTNKNLIQKLIIAIVTVTLFNFCIAPIQVQAAKNKGIITGPIFNLLTDIGDALIQITQWGVIGDWITAVAEKGEIKLINGDTEFWTENSIRYPLIQISPELIFADQIELLNVDFIGATQRDTDKEYNIL